jgi:hypothetical protein
MSPSDLFDDIIQNIDPDEVPLEFIVLAKVTDFAGNERILRGEELAKVMRGPERKRLAEARVILNVQKIRFAIQKGVNEIYDEMNRRVQADEDAAMGTIFNALSDLDPPKDTDI